MSKERHPIPFDEFAGDVAGTIDRVVRTNAPIVVEHNGNQVIVTPLRRVPRRRRGASDAGTTAEQHLAALDRIYRSVPALDPPRTWEEIETIAQEEAARDAMREA